MKLFRAKQIYSKSVNDAWMNIFVVNLFDKKHIEMVLNS